jgi:hypothetical protein
MDSTIFKLMTELKTGEEQVFKNLSIFPLFYTNGNKLEYIALDNAINNKFIEVKEINESGSVPELFIENTSEERILFIEGEELIGAKQNRILNTSILIEKMMKTKIPVSCVEAGRWSHRSSHFSSSSRISPPSLRTNKSRSVSESLYLSSGKSYFSNQRQVWNEVSRISTKNSVSSPTAAMSDVFDSKDDDIQNYLKNFKVLDKQNGMCISINGEIIGIEYVSRPDVFSNLFPKLIRGYAMDALTNQIDSQESGISKDIYMFLRQIILSEAIVYDSIGLGKSHRIQENEFAGEALIVEDEIVHLAVFRRNIDRQEQKSTNTSESLNRDTDVLERNSADTSEFLNNAEDNLNQESTGNSQFLTRVTKNQDEVSSDIPNFLRKIMD